MGERPAAPTQLSTVRSAALHARARALLPGGVNSPVRAMGSVGRDHALFVARGEGPYIEDVDGNRFVDYVCSWGPLIAGHAHPEVLAAVTSAAAAGTSFGAPTEAEVSLAEAVSERVPCAEMVRMTSSGTEAAMSAIRLARAVTGRDAVLKFAGGYHGHSDGLLAEAGSGVATARAESGAAPASGAVPASPGVPTAHAAATTVVAWNDREAVDRALAGRPHAAIICEPYAANMGLVEPEAGFLSFLRERSSAAGALLVFDEVITGFRVARGGAQEREGVTPDLTVLGKVLGGGLPAAAYAGPVELMERVAPAGDVYQAGTLSGNPLATAAGLATLQLLDASAYTRLASTTTALAEGLASAAGAAGAGVTVVSVPGLLTVFFAPRRPRDYSAAAGCDLAKHAAFWRAMLARGIYLPPSQFEAWFPSLVHGEREIEATLEAARSAFAEVA